MPRAKLHCEHIAIDKENLIGRQIIKSKKFINTNCVKVTPPNIGNQNSTTSISAEIKNDLIQTMEFCSGIKDETIKNDENSEMNVTQYKSFETDCEASTILEDTLNERKFLNETFKSLEDELNSIRKMLEATEIGIKVKVSDKIISAYIDDEELSTDEKVA